MKTVEKLEKKDIEKVILKSEKLKKHDRRVQIFKLSLLTLVLFLFVIYLLLRSIYASSNFIIKLDDSLAVNSGLIMFEKLETQINKRILEADKLETMDNISIKWLPANIDESSGGGHNGDNYIAYTFFIQNKNVKNVSYWYEIKIDDVIKNVDEAVRVMIILNGEKKIYAKPDKYTNNIPEGTKAFFSQTSVLVEERADLEPEDVDKFTIVIWLEGDDPDCIDEIVGGEMKMHMEILQENRDN